ncbi:MAG: hypothetical protein KKH52_04800 [Nanoarchaeota archaeon]|nr:hypothetical protein [Nanoarchaeota archaeon]MBU1622169.1 hypothetical protein [Nanoarchaeota archaeon]MBU1974685.1 hypothetical protein [Nanoarchaeota archaeon]
MVSVTMSISEQFQEEIKHFSWINWSEAAREELLKKEIFNRYLKTGEITDEDWIFCQKIDWHPVDELPMKEEFIKRLEEAKKETSIRVNSIKEIFED